MEDITRETRKEDPDRPVPILVRKDQIKATFRPSRLGRICAHWYERGIESGKGGGRKW